MRVEEKKLVNKKAKAYVDEKEKMMLAAMEKQNKMVSKLKNVFLIPKKMVTKKEQKN